MAVGQGSLAGVARVAYEAVGLADFAADNERAERSYRDTTRGMSDEAIRLELAQDRLRRSLQKGPAAFREQARAELALRRETDALTRSQSRQTSGFANLRRGLVLYTGAILGGAGVVQGIRTAISVASNLEEQQNKTRVTFQQSGEEIIQWSRSTATSMGLASDQALQYASTIGGILNVSGLARDESAKLSKELVELAGDMASFNNVPIADALEALRAGLVGESEPLRRLQVLLSETRVKQEAYRLGIAKTGATLTEQQKVQARYAVILKDTADQQGDYARTADGLANSQRTLSALWREAQGIVGQALAPAFTDAVQGLRDWLSETDNQKQLQRDVNTLVGDGVTVVKAFADVLKLAKDAAAPLVTAVGGLGNAIRIMGAAWLVFKARSVLSFAATAAASRATSASMVRDAAVAGRAWDVATRPRVMPVGIVAGGGAGGLGRGALGALGLTPVTAILTGAALVTYFGIRSGQKKAVSDSQFQRMREAAGRGELSREQLAELAPFLNNDQERELRRLIAVAQARGGGAAGSPDSRGDRTTPGSVDAENKRRERQRRQRQQSRGRFTFASFENQFENLEEDELDARGTSGTADDVRVWRRKLALLNRALRELELTRAQRMQLKQARISVLGDLARIEAEEDQEAARIADEQERKRADAQRKAAARRKRMEDAADKASRDRAKLLAGTGGTRENMRRQALRHVDDVVAGAKRQAGAGGGLTADQVRQMQFEFLQGLNGLIGQFGGNLSPDMAQTATQAVVQTHELREQSRMLGILISGQWHPGAQYAGNELAVAGTGVGF